MTSDGAKRIREIIDKYRQPHHDEMEQLPGWLASMMEIRAIVTEKTWDSPIIDKASIEAINRHQDHIDEMVNYPGCYHCRKEKEDKVQLAGSMYKVALKPNTETKELYTNWRHGETRIAVTKYHSGSVQINQTYYSYITGEQEPLGTDEVFIPRWVMRDFIEHLFEIKEVKE